MDNASPPPSDLTMFQISLAQSNHNNIFANGRQQRSIHISIRKQELINGNWQMMPLSPTEVASLALVVDGGSTAQWVGTANRHHFNGRQYRLAENTPLRSFRQITSDSPTAAYEFTPEFTPAPETSLEQALMPIPQEGQYFPEGVSIQHPQSFFLYVSSTLAETRNLTVSVRLDNPSNGMPVRQAPGSVSISAVAPARIRADTLIHHSHQIFDEDWTKSPALHWSLYVQYWDFPERELVLFEGPVVERGGLIHHGRPFHNIHHYWRRHADVPIDPNRTSFNTYDIRRGYSNNPSNGNRNIVIGLAAIRLLQYYENGNNHRRLDRPLDIRFLDQDGNQHLYRLEILHIHTATVQDR